MDDLEGVEVVGVVGRSEASSVVNVVLLSGLGIGEVPLVELTTGTRLQSSQIIIRGMGLFLSLLI